MSHVNDAEPGGNPCNSGNTLILVAKGISEVTVTAEKTSSRYLVCALDVKPKLIKAIASVDCKIIFIIMFVG